MSRVPRPASQNQYLESRVTTASQPELHLMLLDGAQRTGMLAINAWQESGPPAIVHAHLARVMEIVDELTTSVADAPTEVSARLEEEYAFIYRALAAARAQDDLAGVQRALKLLAFQRETWKLVVENLRSGAMPLADEAPQAVARPAAASAATVAMPRLVMDDAIPTGGFSFHA